MTLVASKGPGNPNMREADVPVYRRTRALRAAPKLVDCLFRLAD